MQTESHSTPHMEGLNPEGLRTEFLRLLGIPTAGFAVVASSLWLMQNHLLGNPQATSLATACISAGALAVLDLTVFLHRSIFHAVFTTLMAMLLVALSFAAGSTDSLVLLLTGLLVATYLFIAVVSIPRNQPRITEVNVEPIIDADLTDAQLTDAQLNEVVGDGTVPQEPPTPSRASSGKRLAWGIVLLGTFVYMVVVPTVGYIIEATRKPTGTGHVLTDMTIAETIRLHSVSGIVMLTFLAMGASIGSFLNVVIYRLPRRKPLLWPPSSCASCGTRIAGKDNIPIFGWILLGGHCRTCRAPLSMRYPLIEAIVAAVFVLFYYVELLSGGGNLPVRMQNLYRGIVWILLYTKWDLVSLYFFHLFALSSLLAWGMINWDRFIVPRWSVIKAIALVILLAAIFPTLMPVKIKLGVPSMAAYTSALTSLSGCLLGLVVGFQLRRLFPMSRVSTTDDTESTQFESDRYGQASGSPITASDAVASLGMIGAALGPTTVLSITLLTTSVMLLMQGCCSLRRVALKMPVTIVIFGVAVGYLAAWEQIESIVAGWWLTSRANLTNIPWLTATAFAALLFAMSFLKRSTYAGRARPEDESPSIENHATG